LGKAFTGALYRDSLSFGQFCFSDLISQNLIERLLCVS